MPAVERKLAAIFAADIAGHSRLMGQGEVGTLARLTGEPEHIAPRCYPNAAARLHINLFQPSSSGSPRCRGGEQGGIAAPPDPIRSGAADYRDPRRPSRAWPADRPPRI